MLRNPAHEMYAPFLALFLCVLKKIKGKFDVREALSTLPCSSHACPTFSFTGLKKIENKRLLRTE